MFIVYILKSLRNNKRYVGFTSKTMEQRLADHHRNRNQWTKNNKPFIVLRTETYDTKTEAIKREHFLKSGQGRKYLDDIL